MVVEKAFGTFIMKRGVTRVSITLCSNLNVEHMKSCVLVGRMFSQHMEARLIKWKLGLLWKNGVKNKFYLDHYRRRWFALEFSDEMTWTSYSAISLGKFEDMCPIWRDGRLNSVIWMLSESLFSRLGCQDSMCSARSTRLSKPLHNLLETF